MEQKDTLLDDYKIKVEMCDFCATRGTKRNCGVQVLHIYIF